MCFVFQKPLSSGEVGSEADGPGARPGRPAGSQVAAGSSGSGPIPQTPEIALPFREKGNKTRSMQPSGPMGLILQARKGRGSGEGGEDGVSPIWGPSGGRRDLDHRLARDRACAPRDIGWPSSPPSVAEGPTPSPGSG